MPSQLLVAYDAECPFCRSVADWARGRDKLGLIFFFPIQNQELLRMAPELGGLSLQETIHGIDVSTRATFSGGELWLQLLRRMKGWRWCGYLLLVPGLSMLTELVYNRLNAKCCRGKAEWR